MTRRKSNAKVAPTERDTSDLQSTVDTLGHIAAGIAVTEGSDMRAEAKWFASSLIVK